MSQFFGRKVPREDVNINITLFTEQYHIIEVYGIEDCINDYSDSLIQCYSSNIEDILIDTTCQNVRTSSNEQKKFGYDKKSVFKLKNALSYDNIPYPEDAQISCNFEYEVDETKNNASTILINAPSKFAYSFSKETNKIEMYVKESGASKYQNMMAVRKGYPSDLKIL